MSKFTIKDLTLAALIAAVYAVLTVARLSLHSAESNSGWPRP